MEVSLSIRDGEAGTEIHLNDGKSGKNTSTTQSETDYRPMAEEDLEVQGLDGRLLADEESRLAKIMFQFPATWRNLAA